ncbi:hypothetical protein E8E12_008825 [Didymella heteroderae]|uniref:Heterokaryon incompatibility domain-containing protein n=1 Tax=Didymella heteroderae TaxID=1769908 RepID=A0A9P4WX68_9PLEO|nr:hypothetical protein E8E12_008825 [Didymella heteroderae]
MRQSLRLQAQSRERIYKTRLPAAHIRLIQLVAGGADATLEFYLNEVSIEDLPPFEALSYVWGDANVTEPITCDGGSLLVTVNLANALRKIRSGISPTPMNFYGLEQSWPHPKVEPREKHLVRKTVLLWVDAICINQEDVVERNHQVQYMGVIYNRAQRVIIWLGDTEIEHDQVAVIVAVMQQFEFHLALRLLSHKRLPSHDEFAQLMRNGGYPDIWPAIRAIFASAWYSRVWCVQEALLARDTTVVFDFAEFKVAVLQGLAEWLCERCLFAAWAPPQLEGVIEHISEARDRFVRIGSLHMNFLTFINRYGHLFATDPRDKIYGLASLTSDDVVHVNYSESILAVYSGLVLKLLECGLQILSHVQHPAELIDLEEFPSWVPRWDKEMNKARLYDFPRDNKLSIKRKAGMIDLDLAKSGTLRMSGLLCDTVVSADHFRFDEGLLPRGIHTDTGQLFPKYFLDVWHDINTVDSADIEQEMGSTMAFGTALTGGHTGLHNLVDERDEYARRHFLRSFLATAKGMLPNELMWFEEKGLESSVEIYRGLSAKYCHDRRLFRTSKGWLGLGPRCMRPNDRLVCLDGGPVPYILRPTDHPNCFWFMGECYVYAIARGEAYDMAGNEGVEERVFDLV